MGELALINRDELESKILYFPEPKLTLIHGEETAERFDDMHRLLDKNRAAQFWGVEEQWAEVRGTVYNRVVNKPNNLENRLHAIRFALRTVNDLDEYTQKIAYDSQPDAIYAGYKKTSVKRVTYQTPKHKIGKLPISYSEAHNTPTIRQAAVQGLYEEGDPITEVVRGLESWRAKNLGRISFFDSKVKEGQETFEILLLTSDQSPYAKALGRAAVSHLQS